VNECKRLVPGSASLYATTANRTRCSTKVTGTRGTILNELLVRCTCQNNQYTWYDSAELLVRCTPQTGLVPEATRFDSPPLRAEYLEGTFRVELQLSSDGDGV
jgi:hypothetical protein